VSRVAHRGDLTYKKKFRYTIVDIMTWYLKYKFCGCVLDLFGSRYSTGGPLEHGKALFTQKGRDSFTLLGIQISR
jgi:hypothetical protein